MNSQMNQEESESLVKKIYDEASDYDYKIRDWDVGTVYEKFTNNNYNIGGDNEIYVPTYQRELVWSVERKSRFIESLFLNLPIPFIFLNISNENDLMSLPVHEIIDGSQRIGTLASFINNEFSITGLEDLKDLNGYKYENLPSVLKTKFMYFPLRVVILNGLGEKKRKDIFNRINTSSDMLKSMEIRKGTYEGEFYNLLKDVSGLLLFQKLCPLSEMKKDREEGTELILRFFAYTENYDKYKSCNGKVQKFLDEYMKEKSDYLSIDLLKEEFPGSYEKKFQERKNELEEKFNKTFIFVEKYFENGFKKTAEANVAGSRVYFESISVGVYLALEEDCSLMDSFCYNINDLLSSVEYKVVITSDGANAPKKFYNRIHIMKHFLLTGKVLNLEQLEGYYNSKFGLNEGN